MKRNDKKPRTMLMNFNLNKDTKVNFGNQFYFEINGLPSNNKDLNSVDIITYIDRKNENKKPKVVNMYSSI